MNKWALLLLGFFFSHNAISVAGESAATPVKTAVGSIQFTAPPTWVDVPVTSPMRKATWRTSKEANAAEIAFFAFGKDQGGTVSENIQRWFGQFSDSAEKGESATVTVNSQTITFARSEGTFSSGMPGAATTPLADYALRGAIIETNEGLVFVKMTGPKTTVIALEKIFTDMVTNAAKNS